MDSRIVTKHSLPSLGLVPTHIIPTNFDPLCLTKRCDLPARKRCSAEQVRGKCKVLIAGTTSASTRLLWEREKMLSFLYFNKLARGRLYPLSLKEHQSVMKLKSRASIMEVFMELSRSLGGVDETASFAPQRNGW